MLDTKKKHIFHIFYIKIQDTNTHLKFIQREKNPSSVCKLGIGGLEKSTKENRKLVGIWKLIYMLRKKMWITVYEENELWKKEKVIEKYVCNVLTLVSVYILSGLV